MQASLCTTMGNAMEELRARSMKLGLRNILKASVSEIKHIRYVTNQNMIIAQGKSLLKPFTHLNRKPQKKVSIQETKVCRSCVDNFLSSLNENDNPRSIYNNLRTSL